MKIVIIGMFYSEGFGLHIAETLAAVGHGYNYFNPGFKYGRIVGRLSFQLDHVYRVFNYKNFSEFHCPNIVVNDIYFGEMSGSNVRNFKAALVGAFQRVDWRPRLGQLYVDGKELITFRRSACLKNKKDYCLPRVVERRPVADAGMRRLHFKHFYRSRLVRL